MQVLQSKQAQPVQAHLALTRLLSCEGQAPEGPGQFNEPRRWAFSCLWAEDLVNAFQQRAQAPAAGGYAPQAAPAAPAESGNPFDMF